MSEVRVALYAFHVVSQMGFVVYLVAWILRPDFAHFVAFLTGSGVHFGSEDGALVFSCHAFEHITGAVEMRLKLSYQARFGMTRDAICLRMNGSRMS